MNNTNTMTFKSYRAKTASGLVLVVNEGKNKAGEPCLKVRPMRLIGYSAEWGRAPVAEYSYGDAKWIKASAVSR